jgi:hypothetical protein
MKSIEIEITCASPDALSVSIDYRLEASPIVKKWRADRSVVDEIWSAVHRTVTDALRESPLPGEATERAAETAAGLRSLGLALFQEILKDECDRIRDLARAADDRRGTERPYVIFKIDKSLAYLPLELMYDGRAFLAHSLCLGRVLYAEEAKVGQVSPPSEPYNIVVIGDPSEDVAIRRDVEDEIDAVRRVFKGRQGFALRITLGAEADQKHILANLPGATVLHFSGHGVVSEDEHLTGIKLAGDKILNGYSLKGLQEAPAFAFLNVCTPASQATWRGSLGLVETLLRRGTRACVASLWDLKSKSATLVASRFYADLVGGKTFGEALRESRVEAADRMGLHDPTWASYALYGDPRLTLVRRPAGAGDRTGSGIRMSKRRIALVAGIVALAALVLIPMATRREPPNETSGPLKEGATQASPQESSGAPGAVAVGYLVIESTPKDARILIDGKEVGVTPYAFEMSVGNHDVVLEKRGYRRWEASVEVKQSPRATVKAALEKMQ